MPPLLCFFIFAMFTDAVRADPVDDYLNSEMARRHIPGLVLAVVQNGEVVKRAAYGQADVELGVPATPHSVFQIQSVTKTMTAAAVLLLADEGRLSIDDPIAHHLADVPQTWQRITLRHLLGHTSGIRDFINDPTASIRVDVTEAGVLSAVAPLPLIFAPGERYAYSNTGYHLLAMVIRRVTGKSYGDVLAERFFKPLGMNQTRVVSLSELIPHRVSGYSWSGGALRRGDFIAESILSYGGGGVVSTATDMATWARAMQDGRVLPRHALESAWTPQTLADGTASPYGLGWGIAATNGHRTVGHSGAYLTGFTSHLAHYPDDGLTVIVLTNAGHANPKRIGQRVAGLIDPALLTPDPTPIEDTDPVVTARVRDALIGLSRGDVAGDSFTPELWAMLARELPDWQAAGRGRGHLAELELLSREAIGQRRTYIYRATFPTQKLLVTAILLPDDRITGWRVEDE
jgi:CubicO group peptidase (beta-lactamase class C family)